MSPLLRRTTLLVIAASLFAAPVSPQQKKKLVLAIGDVHRKNYQHDVVSHALSTIERLGRQSGIYDTYIRTDIQLITKQPIQFAEHTAVVTAGDNYLNLNNFDAIFFFGIGELEFTDQQKADFMSFIRQDGKGFVGAHTAVTAFYTWPEFTEMIDGHFDDHPWDIADAPLVVDAPDFPGMKGFGPKFIAHDEFYQLKDYDRSKVRVLAHLDISKLPKNSRIHRTDGDFPMAWARNWGKGRVFNSVMGHTDEAWDNPKMQNMWLEALKWSMGLSSGDATPQKAK